MKIKDVNCSSHPQSTTAPGATPPANPSSVGQASRLSPPTGGPNTPRNPVNCPTPTPGTPGTLGKVCLVGAGPGDPGLITVRGRDRLAQAQVVIYDALASPALLEHVPAGCQIIPTGKRNDPNKLKQDQINQLLLEKAQLGLSVVRLKGGDPYLFGRGAEEASFLAEHGIPVEVIPGITAGIAGPMAAGIAVTRRNVSSSVTFITGHQLAQGPGEPGATPGAGAGAGAGIDYQALVSQIQCGGTLCVYMGSSKLASICHKLLGLGLSADTPVTLIQWASTPQQRSVTTTLGQAQSVKLQYQLGPPMMIVIGDVAGKDWACPANTLAQPLLGQRVMITRTRAQASQLKVLLEEAGAQVLAAPTIELREPENWQPIDQAICNMKQYDWLVLTSANAACALARRLSYLGLDARHLAGVKVAVVGQATGDAVRGQLCIEPELVPENYVAQALAEQLVAEHDIAGKKILMLRADIARQTICQILTDHGGHVADLHIYRNVRPASLPDQVMEQLRLGQVDWITFASSSSVTHLLAILGNEAKALLSGIKMASIGPVTSQTMRSLDLPVAVQAEPSSLAGLVAAMICSTSQ